MHKHSGYQPTRTTPPGPPPVGAAGACSANAELEITNARLATANAQLHDELAFEREQRDDLRRRLGVTSEDYNEATNRLFAVRLIADAMDDVTGARFWAGQLRAALHPQQHADPAAEPESGLPLAWCGASMPGFGGDPVGPCVLRAGHDGPVHQAASGAKWWPTP